MRIGKVSDSVLKRSVLKAIKKTSHNCIKPGPGKDIGIMAFGMDMSDAFVMGTSTAVEEDGLKAIVEAINCSANNVAAGGYKPEAFVINITIPEPVEEQHLRLMMEKADILVRELGGYIATGHTTVSKKVKQVVVSTTCMSHIRLGHIEELKKDKDYDIVMCGNTGAEGAAYIEEMCHGEYKELFSEEYLRDVREALEKLSIVKEAAVAVKHGVVAMHDIHEGGVFGALWELCEQVGCGMEVDLRRLPIKQSTVEICERVDVNPYILTSMGAILLVTEDGQSLVAALEKENIGGCVVGATTKGKERLLINKGEKRYLDKPAIDEIYRIKDLKEEVKLCVKKY